MVVSPYHKTKKSVDFPSINRGRTGEMLSENMIPHHNKNSSLTGSVESESRSVKFRLIKNDVIVKPMQSRKNERGQPPILAPIE